MTNIFKLKKEERWIALVALFVFISLNAIFFYKYGSIITRAHHVSYWYLFGRTVHVSGFDDWSYLFMSNGKIYFEITRHPLFAVLLYPFYELNRWLIQEGDINYAFFFMGITLLFSALYSFIFIYRIFKEIIQVSVFDSVLLSSMFFSFGMIMVACVVPDHFCWSIFLLTMTLYLAGKKIKEGKKFKTWQMAVLAFFTAGVTLSNVAKTYISALFTNGKSSFTVKNVVSAILLPMALLAGITIYQVKEVYEPQQYENHRLEVEALKNDSSLKIRNEKHHKQVMAKTAKPITDKPFLKWIDVTTPRVASAVENLFGESIQLHQSYLLRDMCDNRPMIVKYDRTINYVVEGFIFLLFVIGIVIARKDKFFMMIASWFALDMFLHLVLGFGLNEVYIMAPHWILFIPVVFAYLLKRLTGKAQLIARYSFLFITLYLWAYNGSLFLQFMGDRVTTIFK